MRLLVALLTAALVAGCGTEPVTTDEPASSGPAVEATAPDVDPSGVKPPVIVLRSEHGDQKAVPGSYCIDYVDQETGQGVGTCADSTLIQPKEATGVMRGDEVSFVFTGAEIVSPSGCHSDDPQGCIGSVTVKPLGCEDRSVGTVPLALGPETRWGVDLEPGVYELDVFGYFESGAGATGDVSGTLGLTVSGPKANDALGVTELKPSMQVCEPG